MKQHLGILILLMGMTLVSTGQSRVLVGTISSKPNESTTLLPTIVTLKNTQGQVNDSALFNPRYVPPAIDNTNSPTTISNNQDIKTQLVETKQDNPTVTNNQVNNSQGKFFIDGHNKSVTLTPSSPYPVSNPSNTSISETYQYKTQDNKPVIDQTNNQQTLTPTISYKKPNQVSTSTDEYQYKTPDSKPLLDKAQNQQTLTPPVVYKQQERTTSNEEIYQYKTADASPQLGYVPVKKKTIPPPGFHTTRKALANGADNVTDPDDLAANNNYGNEPEKNVVKVVKKKSKWVNPYNNRKVDYYPTVASTVANNNQSTENTDSKLLTPPIRVKSVPKKKADKPVNYNQVSSDNIQTDNTSSKQNNQTSNAVRPDYKINLTNDGKYTLTFSNNGGSVVLTAFGRIANVISPIGGNNSSSQYNYRGLLDKVGNLPLQYTYEGRVQSVGSTQLDYNYNGNIQTIGNTSLYYNYNGTIDKIGNTKVYYDANGNVSGTSDANPIIAMKQ